MRNRTTLTLLLGVILGISGASYLSQNSEKRAPSSLQHKKILFPKPLGKHLALLKVDVSPAENIPATSDADLQLTGRILVNNNFSGDISYSWSIPEDVQVITGATQDTLSNVKTGDILEVHITVRGFSKEKQQLIALQASGLQAGNTLGNSAIITSRPEDTWEAVAPEMKKAADEQLGTEAKNHRSR